MSFLQKLNWRFATKKFDPSKKLDREVVLQIVESARMAPTSFGLQPFHITVVENKDVREKMKPVAWNQAQITDASCVLVFSARTDVATRIDEYLRLISGDDEEKRKSLESYGEMMRGFASNMNEEALFSWASRQAYIALGFALASSAELGVDSCPMEGFSQSDMDSVLNQPKNFRSVVLLPLGYRLEGPEHPKARFGVEDMISFVE